MHLAAMYTPFAVSCFLVLVSGKPDAFPNPQEEELALAVMFTDDGEFRYEHNETDPPRHLKEQTVPMSVPAPEIFSPLYGEWWSAHLELAKAYGLALSSHLVRFKQFKANFLKMVKLNSRNRTYKLGLGPFTHLSSEEFSKYADFCHQGFDLAKGTDKNASQHFGGLINHRTTLPKSVDWESKGKVTEVKCQAQCGSCWAYATVAAIESRYAITRGRLRNFSERELIDCSPDGPLIDSGYEYVIRQGLRSSEDYQGCPPEGSGSLRNLVTSYMHAIAQDESSLLAGVASGPVAAAIQGDQWDMQHYRSGVFSGSFCNIALNHAALIVGYGSDLGSKYWRLKNSWGTRWGEQGYFRLVRDSDRNNEYGQCGITMRASYPIISGLIA